MNLNDYNGDSALAPKSADANNGDLAPKTQGEDPGDFGTVPGLGPVTGHVASRRVGGGTIIIVAVVLTAIAGLFSMRKLADVTAAAGIDAEIEATIEKFLDSLADVGPVPAAGSEGVNDEVVIALLRESYSERQVPLRDVARNPFVIDQIDTTVVPPPIDQTAISTREQERLWNQQRENRQRIWSTDAGSLRLKAVMGGSNPLAIIDGETVRVGETILGKTNQTTFRVSEISKGSVELLAEAPELDMTETYTLQLER
ncbi:MAG: hypothetical protein HKO59_14620 [Phycisphaerales bacterium]|nr:hypothetical protein [Phycisphaerae bacterium]NNF43822.1 hypothetical protein [Phycisphaerales bacterium]NNM27192.1 hypothetical protein [Phycisphaerales bacterium]